MLQNESGLSIIEPVKRISQRSSKVSPILAMDILALAIDKEAKGDKVLHLEVGQPSASAPRAAIEAAQKALQYGQIGYTNALGITPLKERISKHYKDCYQVDVPANRIVITTGSSAAFVLSFLCLFDAGSRVAISEPGYPAYRAILKALDIEPVAVRLKEENRFVMTPEDIEEAAQGKSLDGVLTISPSNPSGTMMNIQQLSAISLYAQKNNLWYISDEIYHGVTYMEKAATALEENQDVVVINSFSKYYCMTGWRIGWMVVPPELVRPIERIAQNFYLCPPYLSQVAALAVFDAIEELEKIREGYARNRSMLLEELSHIGVTRIHPADGAFYIYADVSKYTDNSLDFCKKLLKDTGVAISSGLDFDLQDGHHWVRLSFARSFEECHEAVIRLGQWLKNN